MVAKLDESWKGWLDENIQRGCNKEELLGILLKNKFSLRAIREAMGPHFPMHSPLVAGALHTVPEIDYDALANVRITRLGSEEGVERVDTDKLQLYTMQHFMSDEECDRLVAVINTALRPSTLTTNEPDQYFRTSSTSDLSLLKNPFVEEIDRKIANALGINLAYSEGIQAQKYEVGQEFKPHTDYFQPNTDEYTRFASQAGNRTWTFMVYLNDTPAGGGTQFVNIHKTFLPKKGMAVIWNNLYEDGTVNYDTLHWGMQVEEGHKVIITKWFREKGHGPMFTD